MVLWIVEDRLLPQVRHPVALWVAFPGSHRTGTEPGTPVDSGRRSPGITRIRHSIIHRPEEGHQTPFLMRCISSLTWS